MPTLNGITVIRGVNPVKHFYGGISDKLVRAVGIMMSNKRRTLRINPCEGHLRRDSPSDGSFFLRGERDREQGKAKEKDARNHFNTPTWGACTEVFSRSCMLS